MKKFIIPQIVDDSPKKVEEQEKKVEDQKYRPERFVSSVFGTNVKDEITYNGAQFGNKGRQYDVFRDKDKRVNKEDYRDYLTYNIDRSEYEKESLSRTSRRNSQVNPRNNIVNQDEHDYHESIVFADDKEEYPDKKIVKEFNKIEQLTQVYDDLEIDYEEEEPNIPLDDYIEEKPVQQARPIQRERKKPVETVTNNNKVKQQYKAPPLSILKKGKPISRNDMSAVLHQREQIDMTLAEFGISGRVVRYTKGPAVTQFEVQLDPGVRVQRVKNISSNIMADLKAKSLRIQAPIPGKSTVGIEVPNLETDLVLFGELLNNEEFLNDGNPMNAVLGLDLSGQPVYLNIAKMPHALIGGTTGSGKSVCINSIINSIIYKAHPDDVRLILIDPKIIEFSYYEDIPHLATPVITEPKIAAAALRWAVEEMENRYQLFRTHRVREYEEYAKVAAKKPNVKHIPYLVIIIDELADLMLIAGNDVEDYIQRLTQKGRASGIHLIIATQRPSVDVIKGTIKTNIPTRIAFLVKTQVDSSIILDHSGAEKLLGNGDMLYNDSINEQRLQGAYISQEEILTITDYISEHSDANYMFTEEDLQEKLVEENLTDGVNDEYFQVIARFVVENNSASINRIQKTFGIGFNRAQSIMQGMEELNIVSQNLGSRARTVQVNLEQLEGILDNI